MTGRRLLGDRRGAAVVEAAFALPVLILVMVGSLQVFSLLHASGEIRHAVGEGIRFARVDRTATSEEIEARVRASLIGVDSARISALEAERGILPNDAEFARISIEYRFDLSLPFLPLPPIMLEEEKLTYLPD